MIKSGPGTETQREPVPQWPAWAWWPGTILNYRSTPTFRNMRKMGWQPNKIQFKPSLTYRFQAWKAFPLGTCLKNQTFGQNHGGPGTRSVTHETDNTCCHGWLSWIKPAGKPAGSRDQSRNFGSKNQTIVCCGRINTQIENFDQKLLNFTQNLVQGPSWVLKAQTNLDQSKGKVTNILLLGFVIFLRYFMRG